MTDFYASALAWLRGWKFILQNRKLLVLAMVPFMISMVMAVMSLWLIWVYYPVAMEQMVPSWLKASEGWRSVLYEMVLWTVGFVVTLFVFYLLYVLQAVIAMPFYSWLADTTLNLRGYPRARAPGFLSMLRVSLLKGTVFLILGALLLVISFVPGLNVAAIIGTLLLLAFDCFDYSLEALGLGFRERVRYVTRNRAQWAGTAVGLGLTLFLPGLTLLVIPGAVVGAALLLKETDGSRTHTP